MATIGFVGLGGMGSRCVRRLLVGNTVCGTNRTPEKAAGLVSRGMIWRETPRHVTRPVDIIFTVVSDDTALRAVHEGPDGILAGLRHGQIVVDMSTVGPLAEKAAIDPAQAASVMTDSPIGSPAQQTRAPMALHLPQRSWFDMRAMRKDLRLATDTAAGLGIHMATAAVVSEAVDLAVDHGYANRDLARLYAALHGRIPAIGDPSGSRW